MSQVATGTTSGCLRRVLSQCEGGLGWCESQRVLVLFGFLRSLALFNVRISCLRAFWCRSSASLSRCICLIARDHLASLGGGTQRNLRMPFTGKEIRRLRGASRAHLSHVRLLRGLLRLGGTKIAQGVRAHFVSGLGPGGWLRPKVGNVLEVRWGVGAAG